MTRPTHDDELGRLDGQYILIAEARASVIEAFTACRNRLLKLPTKMARRLAPELRVKVCRLVDALIRECLEDLASRPRKIKPADYRAKEACPTCGHVRTADDNSDDEGAP